MAARVKTFGQGPQRAWVRIKGHWIPDNEESTDTSSGERDCVFFDQVKLK